MYSYRLTNFLVNDTTKIVPGNLMVIVGPNNSGKSRALKDIAQLATAQGRVEGVVVKDIDFTLPDSLEELRNAYGIERYNENQSWIFRRLEADLCSEINTSGGPIWPKGYEFRNEKISKAEFISNYGDAMVAFLTTEHRLQLVKESSSPSHQHEAASILQMLYNAGRPTEYKIRDVVKQAFQKEIALDFTVLQNLALRVGNSFPQESLDPRDARQDMSKHEKLDNQGDGLRSFVGIIIAMLSVKRSLFLIDEPEAFLHPPQAFKMGAFIAEQASETRQVITATHSSDVLRGILSATRDVTILRIDRIENKNHYRLLEPDRLKELVNDPLLSSARVLDGLFILGLSLSKQTQTQDSIKQLQTNEKTISICILSMLTTNKQFPGSRSSIVIWV